MSDYVPVPDVPRPPPRHVLAATMERGAVEGWTFGITVGTRRKQGSDMRRPLELLTASHDGEIKHSARIDDGDPDRAAAFISRLIWG